MIASREFVRVCVDVISSRTVPDFADKESVNGQGDKILDIAAAADRVRSAMARGDTVVMCHGCFDIVHPGHIRHLQQAARLGDRLLVSVTGDAMVSKGHCRPLIPQELRAENLAAIDVVDWVMINSAPTAAEVLQQIQPDVYVKGREYEHNHDPRFAEEKRIVQANGGRVVFTSGDVVFSSTALIASLDATVDPARSQLAHLMDQHELDQSHFQGLVENWVGRRVLVIGETILDTYVFCDRPEVAGESAMMTLRPLEYRRYDGGAAIIARHLAAMGAKPTLVTALPAGPASESLRLRLEVEGIHVHAIDTDQPIIEKQRFLVGTTKVIKLDLGDSIVLDANQQIRAVNDALAIASECDAAIISDFGLGFLTAPMLRSFSELVRKHVQVLAGDVSGRRSNLLSMCNMDLLTPAEIEIRTALNDHEEGLSAVVWRLLEQTQSRAALVTLGDEGLIAFRERSESPNSGDGWASRLHAEHVPSLAAHAVDQLGCGDALLAAATLALLAGGAVESAAVMGSVAAAIEAQRLGNIAVTSADLRRAIAEMPAPDKPGNWQADSVGRRGDLDADLSAAHAQSA